MDVTQALRDAENSLRDFIAFMLSKSGEDWLDRCGVPAERIAKWQERKVIEGKRQETGVVEERLIYYADFYDLKTILKKHWSDKFTLVFGDWKTLEVYLTELERLRDPDAHRRELLPHQKNLVLGISGEIRNRIVRFRSKMETPEDCFPRIESARDSLGNIWVPDSHWLKLIDTKATLRPGDVLDFVITATDPEDFQLEYSVESVGQTKWQSDPSMQFLITNSHIGRSFYIELSIKSSREYHAKLGYDDRVTFQYCVLPSKN
jgi:hypothetical protein